MVEEESSSHETQVYNLVKLFENRLLLKDDAKSVILKKLARGVPPRRVGEMS